MPSFYDGLSISDAFWGSLSQTRAMMQERAERISWEEAQPSIQAELERAAEPMREADRRAAELEAHGEDSMASQGAIMRAQAQFATNAMQIARRLGGSTNRFAKQYSEQLLQTATSIAETGLKFGQQFETMRAARMQEQIESARVQLGKDELQQRKDQEARMAEDADLDRGLEQEKADIMKRQAAVSEGDLGLRREQFEFEKKQPARPEDTIRLRTAATDALANGVPAATINRVLLAPLGITVDELKSEPTWDAELDQDAAELETMGKRIKAQRERGEAVDAEVEAQWQQENDLLRTRQAEIDREKLKLMKERRENPGWFWDVLNELEQLPAPPGKSLKLQPAR